MAQELKVYNVVASSETQNYLDGEINLAFEAYDANEVDALLAEKDAAIEELKQKLAEKDKEIESLKASHYAESVDAGMRERRLRRLLWHAIALFCARSCEYFNGIMSHCLMGQDDLYKRCEEKKNKYLHAMYKSRAKAEAYK